MLALVALYHDNLHEAGQLLERALGDVGEHLPLRVQTLVTLSFARLNTGDLAGALRIAENAVTDAERLGYPPLLSQALTMAVHLRFRLGEGLDEPRLHRALQLEDPDTYMPAVFRPNLAERPAAELERRARPTFEEYQVHPATLRRAWPGETN